MTAFGNIKDSRATILPQGSTPGAGGAGEVYGWLGDVVIKALAEMGVVLLDTQPVGTVVASYPAPSDAKTILMVLAASGGATCYIYSGGSWANLTPALFKSAYGSAGGGAAVGTTGGTANALTLSSVSPAITALSAGTMVAVQPTATNSGTATVNVSGLGAKAIVSNAGTALVGGEMATGREHLLIYDGTSFQLVNPAAASIVSHATTFPVPTSAGQVFVDDTTGKRYVSVQDAGGYSWVLDSNAVAGGVGIGQTWQDMFSSRAPATQYTNNTGKPIMVYVRCGHDTQGGGFVFFINGVQLMFSDQAWAAGGYITGTTIVPAGATYAIATTAGVLTLQQWYELR